MRHIWATVLAASTLVLLPTTAQAAPTCGGRTATIVGTAGNDFRYGTAGNGVVVLGDGDDRFYGGTYSGVAGGVDLVCGGNGRDLLESAGTSTTLWGGAGNDLLVAGSGTTVSYGGDGDDSLAGKNGVKDRFYGGAGNDSLGFSGGQVLLDGGYGSDSAQLGTSPVAGVRLDLPNQRLTWQGVNTRVVSVENAYSSQFPTP